MKIAPELVQSVKEGKCILFLGAMASAHSPDGCRYEYKVTPPGGGELSERLAKRFTYPFDDRRNLQRVSLYGQFREGGSRQELVRAIAEEIARPSGDEHVNEELRPSPALRMLASLPFRVVITTNYDRLFDIAFGDAKTLAGWRKTPILRVYDPTRSGQPQEVPIDPDEAKPILLKLHGDIDQPESIVITEEDYITFVQRMSNAYFHPIHEYIRVRMRGWPILFVGYSLKDYNLRLLFRTLRWGIDVASFPLSFSVDPYPDNLVVAVWQRSAQPMVSFIENDLWAFVPALYRAVCGTDWDPPHDQ